MGEDVPYLLGGDFSYSATGCRQGVAAMYQERNCDEEIDFHNINASEHVADEKYRII